jgi:hypothetical protein
MKLIRDSRLPNKHSTRNAKTPITDLYPTKGLPQ